MDICLCPYGIERRKKSYSKADFCLTRCFFGCCFVFVWLLLLLFFWGGFLSLSYSTILVFQKTSPDEDEQQEDDMNDFERREHMLEQLLAVLNSAAAMGLGPDPGDLGKQYQETNQQITRLFGGSKGLSKG